MDLITAIEALDFFRTPLPDDKLDGVSVLLGESFPEFDGFLPIQYALTNDDLSLYVSKKRDVLQILYYQGHYALLHHNIKTKTTILYDSLHSLGLRDGFQKQADALLNGVYNGPVPIQLETKYQEQRDGWSCGYRSFAALVDVCRRRNPTEIDYGAVLPSIYSLYMSILESPNGRTRSFIESHDWIKESRRRSFADVVSGRLSAGNDEIQMKIEGKKEKHVDTASTTKTEKTVDTKQKKTSLSEVLSSVNRSRDRKMKEKSYKKDIDSPQEKTIKKVKQAKNIAEKKAEKTTGAPRSHEKGKKEKKKETKDHRKSSSKALKVMKVKKVNKLTATSSSTEFFTKSNENRMSREIINKKKKKREFSRQTVLERDLSVKTRESNLACENECNLMTISELLDMTLFGALNRDVNENNIKEMRTLLETKWEEIVAEPIVIFGKKGQEKLDEGGLLDGNARIIAMKAMNKEGLLSAKSKGIFISVITTLMDPIDYEQIVKNAVIVGVNPMVKNEYNESRISNFVSKCSRYHNTKRKSGEYRNLEQAKLALKVALAIDAKATQNESPENLVTLASEYAKRYLISETYQFLIVGRGAGGETQNALIDLSLKGGHLSNTGNLIRNVVYASRRDDEAVAKIIREYISTGMNWSCDKINSKLRLIDRELSETLEAKRKREEREKLRRSSITLSKAKRFGANPWIPFKLKEHSQSFENKVYVASHTMFLQDQLRSVLIARLDQIQALVVVGPITNFNRYVSLAPEPLIKFCSCINGKFLFLIQQYSSTYSEYKRQVHLHRTVEKRQYKLSTKRRKATQKFGRLSV